VSEAAKVFALRPEFLESWRNINDALKSNMDPRYYELATIAASSSIRCTA
jgi:alkylhydroperoxidase/carboxymuconolactone decarboxylase family protein YurZ